MDAMYAAEVFQRSLESIGFWENFWENKPLVFSVPDLAMEKCLTQKEILRVLGICVAFQPESLRLFKNGEVYNMPEPLSSASPLPLYLAYLDGTSFIINRADRFNSDLFKFCQILGQRLLLHAFAVLYMTPAKSNAVNIHTDDQDVFLVQVQGSKKWKVFKAPQVPGLLIYSNEQLGKTSSTAVPETPILLETTLKPGQILYIPRGCPHVSESEEQCSVHVTITVPTSDFGWGAWLTEGVMDALAKDAGGRLLARRARLVPKAQDDDYLLAETPTDEAAGAAFQQFTRDVMAKINLQDREQAFLEKLRTINDGARAQNELLQSKASHLFLESEEFIEATIQLDPNISVECEEDGTTAVFHRNSASLALPIYSTAAPIIRALSSREAHKIMDLPCVDPFERVAVAFVLFKKELIRIVPNA